MGDETTSGAGICSVKIGDREFTCLRVIYAEGSAKKTDAPFNESYITQAGRTVLIRSPCHDCHENIVVDRTTQLSVDNETRFLWYDVLTQHTFDL